MSGCISVMLCMLYLPTSKVRYLVVENAGGGRVRLGDAVGRPAPARDEHRRRHEADPRVLVLEPAGAQPHHRHLVRVCLAHPVVVTKQIRRRRAGRSSTRSEREELERLDVLQHQYM